MQIKKVIIAGDWYHSIYEESFAVALKELNIEVIPFRIKDFFNGFIGKFQKAIPIIAPTLLKINLSLLNLVKLEKPELLIAWRCTHLLPYTIKKINDYGIVSVSYNNDDPFGPKMCVNTPWHHKFLWYWYIKCLFHFKFNFFIRELNVMEANKIGIANAHLLRSYFIPWKDKPISLSKDELMKYSCDIIFIGHYEPDDRVNYLKALVQSGFSVKIYGGKYWNLKSLGNLYYYFAPIVPVVGIDYAKALCGAKICLSFLSKINRDTYTRRCFEIPACGRLMLAERTDELQNLFEEDKEACFFSNCEELINKAKWLINNPAISQKIAIAGQNRVWSDKHDIKSRATELLNLVQSKRIH